jgi:hypothetical protein
MCHEMMAFKYPCCGKFISYTRYNIRWGHAVAELVEAPCYKPEGRGFDSR